MINPLDTFYALFQRISVPASVQQRWNHLPASSQTAAKVAGAVAVAFLLLSAVVYQTLKGRTVKQTTTPNPASETPPPLNTGTSPAKPSTQNTHSENLEKLKQLLPGKNLKITTKNGETNLAEFLMRTLIPLDQSTDCSIDNQGKFKITFKESSAFGFTKLGDSLFSNTTKQSKEEKGAQKVDYEKWLGRIQPTLHIAQTIEGQIIQNSTGGAVIKLKTGGISIKSREILGFGLEAHLEFIQVSPIPDSEENHISIGGLYCGGIKYMSIAHQFFAETVALNLSSEEEDFIDAEEVSPEVWNEQLSQKLTPFLQTPFMQTHANTRASGILKALQKSGDQELINQWTDIARYTQAMNEKEIDNFLQFFENKATIALRLKTLRTLLLNPLKDHRTEPLPGTPTVEHSPSTLLSPQEQLVKELTSGFSFHPGLAEGLLQTIFRKNEAQIWDFDIDSGNFTLKFPDHKTVKLSKLPEKIEEKIKKKGLETVANQLMGQSGRIHQELKGQITRYEGRLKITFESDAYKANLYWPLKASLTSISVIESNEISLEFSHNLPMISTHMNVKAALLIELLKLNFNPPKE